MDKIVTNVIFNDEAPSKSDYKYFQLIMEDGSIEEFHHHKNNPIPTKEEMLGLTLEEVRELYTKKFYEAIGQVYPKPKVKKEVVEYVKITKNEYEILLNAQAKLDALCSCGVDNWEGYPYAMRLLKEDAEEPHVCKREDIKKYSATSWECKVCRKVYDEDDL